MFPKLDQRFGIELENSLAGRLLTLDPGLPTAEVIVENRLGGGPAKKHIGQPVYPATSFTCGAGMSRPFFEWIKAALDEKHLLRKAAVVAFSDKNMLIYRLQFVDAIISEVTFPALDAASKDAAALSVKITPSMARMQYGSSTGGSGETIEPGIYWTTALKPWRVADFRLSIDGLNSACSRVSKIGALTASNRSTTDASGSSKESVRVQTGSGYSNLIITLPSTYVKEFADWMKSFVIEGKSGDDQEKNGFLEYLPPNSQKPYFRVDLKHLGIMRMSAPRAATAGDSVEVEMYCEDMDFSFYNTAVVG